MIERVAGLPRNVFHYRFIGHISKQEFTELVIEIERSYEDGYDMAILFEFDPEVQIEESIWGREFDNRMALRGRTQRFELVARDAWRPRFDSFSEFVTAFGTETQMFGDDRLSEAREWVASADFVRQR